VLKISSVDCASAIVCRISAVDLKLRQKPKTSGMPTDYGLCQVVAEFRTRSDHHSLRPRMLVKLGGFCDLRGIADWPLRRMSNDIRRTYAMSGTRLQLFEIGSVHLPESQLESD